MARALFHFDKEIASLKKEYPNESNKFYTLKLLEEAEDLLVQPDALLFDEP